MVVIFCREEVKDGGEKDNREAKQKTGRGNRISNSKQQQTASTSPT